MAFFHLFFMWGNPENATNRRRGNDPPSAARRRPGARARRRRIVTMRSRSAWPAWRCSQNSAAAAHDPRPV